MNGVWFILLVIGLPTAIFAVLSWEDRRKRERLRPRPVLPKPEPKLHPHGEWAKKQKQHSVELADWRNSRKTPKGKK